MCINARHVPAGTLVIRYRRSSMFEDQEFVGASAYHNTAIRAQFERDLASEL
jgi:hypothetical protein